MRNARTTIADAFGAKESEFAVTQNCAQALSIAALGFPLKPMDSVVILDQEYASNFYPWREACNRSGAELVVVPSPPDRSIDHERLLSAIRPGVKLVAISWVQFQTGAIADLERIGNHCRGVGAHLIVDGIQGMGQLPIDFQSLPIDFLAGGNHKWMSSLLGMGYFFGKKPFLDLLRAPSVGAATYNRIGMSADLSIPKEPAARSFEAGGLSFIHLFALEESAALLKETGAELIASEIHRLSKRLREGLLESGPVELITPLHQPGGITSFRISPNQESHFLEACKKNRVALAKRGDLIRISPHAYNTDSEVDFVLELLRSGLQASK